MGSSLMPNHLLSSQEAPSARPELQRESDRLKLLLDITNTLVSNLGCRDLLRTVSASIRQVMHCDIVGVWLPDAQQMHLRQLAMDFPESKGFFREDWQLPVEGSELGRVFKTGEPVVVRTRAGFVSDWSTPMAHAEDLESGCALPLISRGRTLGVLTLGSRVENSVSAEDVDFLMQAAGQVAIAIENALAYREIAELKDKLAQEKLYLEDEIRGEMDFEGIVGQSSALRHVLNLVETVAPSDSTVLLLGETGTGKELIARAIHERSRRKERTFVKLNCAAIPTGLLESELFGHERGAFTGAIAQKIGRLELADQGSLFLDEVGDIPVEIQPKLLRALQERDITVFCVVPQFFYLIHERIFKELKKRGELTLRLARTLMALNRALRRARLNAGKVFFGKIHATFGARMRYLITGGSRFDPAIARDFYSFGIDVLNGLGDRGADRVVHRDRLAVDPVVERGAGSGVAGDCRAGSADRRWRRLRDPVHDCGESLRGVRASSNAGRGARDLDRDHHCRNSVSPVYRRAGGRNSAAAAVLQPFLRLFGQTAFRRQSPPKTKENRPFRPFAALRRGCDFGMVPPI